MTLSYIDKLMSEALQLHRDGCLAEAEKKYATVLENSPDYPPALHNLGMVLLGQGKLKPGVKLVDRVLSDEISFPGQARSYREVGMTLYRFRYWEEARPWLLKAAEYSPEDQDLLAALKRIEPRQYLAPEVFDPVAGEVLKRYTPRESENYVYVIDVMGNCNLRCPSCPVGNFKEATRKRGMMDSGLFERIIARIVEEQGKETVEVWLYNWGEPLLHPDLPRFVETLHGHGLRCHLSSNLNVKKGIGALIATHPDELKISISGFNPSAYGLTHRGGNLYLLKSNMYRLRYYLDTFKANTRVWVGHHVYRSSREHAEEVRALCHELDFEYHQFQAFYQPLEKLLGLVQGTVDETKEPVLENLLIHPVENTAHIRLHRSGFYDCELRFNQTVINFDGSVALCCGVYDRENMLGVQFLDTSTAERELLKYAHPFCGQCRKAGLDYSVSELPADLTPTRA